MRTENSHSVARFTVVRCSVVLQKKKQQTNQPTCYLPTAVRPPRHHYDCAFAGIPATVSGNVDGTGDNLCRAGPRHDSEPGNRHCMCSINSGCEGMPVRMRGICVKTCCPASAANSAAVNSDADIKLWLAEKICRVIIFNIHNFVFYK